MKDSVPLSPLKPSATAADTEQQGTERRNSALGKDLQSPHVSMETSNLRPQTPKAEDEVEEDDEASGPLTISELVYRSIEFYKQIIKIFYIYNVVFFFSLCSILSKCFSKCTCMHFLKLQCVKLTNLLYTI